MSEKTFLVEIGNTVELPPKALRSLAESFRRELYCGAG